MYTPEDINKINQETRYETFDLAVDDITEKELHELPLSSDNVY